MESRCRKLSEGSRAYIIKHYSRLGPTFLAQSYRVRRSAIQKIAKQHDLQFGDKRGYVSTAVLERLTGRRSSYIFEQAQRDGAALKLGHPNLGPQNHALQVKEEWADAFVARCEREDEAETLGYLSLAETARTLGLSRTFVHNAILGKGRLADVFARAHIVRGRKRRILINPWDVERARRHCQRMRRAGGGEVWP